MNEDFLETTGMGAGKVWKCLNTRPQTSFEMLIESTGMESAEVHRALGWLAREGKIAMDVKNGIEYFNLVF